MAFPLCSFSNAVLNDFLHQYTWDKSCMYMLILLYVWYVVSKTFVTMAAFIWLLPCVCSLTVSQIAYFSNTFFSICVLMWIVIIVYSGGVTNVYLQQNTFYKGCIYMASPIYVFSGDLLDYLFWAKKLSQWLYSHEFYSVLALWWLIWLFLRAKHLSHWLHLYGFSSMCVVW